ncbi:Uncharacterized integral membrane protein [Rhizobacter sp. OV335]|nr:Uncharacterized integral membrane protein [Rhizobacter sp. OV335]
MMRIAVWLFRAFIFFSLFAFALNNQHDANVHWFFGQEWHAPMVFVVLGAFAFGCAFGVLAMVPSWWRNRRLAQRRLRRRGDHSELADSALTQSSELPTRTDSHPPRDGL